MLYFIRYTRTHKNASDLSLIYSCFIPNHMVLSFLSLDLNHYDKNNGFWGKLTIWHFSYNKQKEKKLSLRITHKSSKTEKYFWGIQENSLVSRITGAKLDELFHRCRIEDVRFNPCSNSLLHQFKAGKFTPKMTSPPSSSRFCLNFYNFSLHYIV